MVNVIVFLSLFAGLFETVVVNARWMAIPLCSAIECVRSRRDIINVNYISAFGSVNKNISGLGEENACFTF